MTRGTGRSARRVLIVASAYRPAMLADMQRARMLAWELPRLGWDVEVLAPRASEVRQDAIEPEPSGFYADTPVHEVGSLVRGAFEALGSHTHAWRTLLPMARAGAALLRTERFDAVFFTTTTFIYFALGPRWMRRYGVPYVLDFHDPWIREGSSPASRAGLRSRAAEGLAARMEREAVVNAAGVVSVSPGYLAALAQRHAASNPRWVGADRQSVIPFGALASDLDEAARTRPDAAREAIVLRYVGVGGTIMRRSFAAICRALSALRARGDAVAARARIELHGTMYGWRRGEPLTLAEVAAQEGVADLVAEYPERVSYRRSLELLLESDGALILGVDDAAYMPSKLVGYALSGKPLLTALHRDGPGHAQIAALAEGAHALWFAEGDEMPSREAIAAVERFLGECASRRRYDRRAELEPLLAPAMARRIACVLDEAIVR